MNFIEVNAKESNSGTMVELEVEDSADTTNNNINNDTANNNDVKIDFTALETGTTTNSKEQNSNIRSLPRNKHENKLNFIDVLKMSDLTSFEEFLG